MSMLYQAYQFQDDLVAPFRSMARSWLNIFGTSLCNVKGVMGGQYVAALEMISRFELTHVRPDFAIEKVTSGNAEVKVTPEVALSLPFGNLLHFTKDSDVRQPKVMVIAPLSGHFSTLLRGTVETLLRDHDVYITDWANARDVPVEAGQIRRRGLRRPTSSGSSRRSARALTSSQSASPASRRWWPSQ
jgi:poly(3-hydroxybutyrate) depolymerase